MFTLRRSQRNFGVNDQPACPKCGKALFLTRRTPHPEYGPAFERQTFTCLSCDHAIERSADAYGNSQQKSRPDLRA